MKNLRYYFNKAKKEGFAIGQFNFSDFSQMKAIVAAAQKTKSPIILGTSEGEGKFFGLEEAVAMRNVLRKKTRSTGSGQVVPIFLNLDHGKSFENVKKAIDAGYDMVHFDGSKLPFEENVKIMKQVKNYASWRGVLVEGELGIIGTESSQVYTQKFEIKEENLTKPDEAKKFAGQSAADLFAISIGNFHGVEDSGQEPRLRLDRLEEIRKSCPKSLFVLHGGSGTNEEDVKKAISMGIVKININTELRLAFAKGLRSALCGGSEIVPYKFLPFAQQEVEKIVESKIGLFTKIN